MGKYSRYRRTCEKKIGRKLTEDEITHHKDHNRENNEGDNLEPMIEHEHNILHFKGKNALYKYRRKRILTYRT